jgi:hypothetical protein
MAFTGTDLQSMIFRIAAELGARFDLAGAVGSASQSAPNSEAIRNAINTAISIYQKQRFRFSEIDPSNPPTFTTRALDSTYTTSDSPILSSAYFIDYLNIQIGNTLQEMTQVSPERQHLNIQLFTQFGMPTSWAYEFNTVILYPVPSDAYTIYIGAHIAVPGPTSDTDTTNVWMQPQNGERLIRCRAKYEIATHVTRNATMAAAMSPEPDGNNGQPGEAYRAFRALKGEGNKITSTRSRIKPMAF